MLNTTKKKVIAAVVIVFVILFICVGFVLSSVLVYNNLRQAAETASSSNSSVGFTTSSSSTSTKKTSSSKASVIPEPGSLVVDENYQLNLPAGWEAQEITGYGEVNFYFPVEETDNPDGFAENINVIVQEVGTMSLQEYHELSSEQIESGDYIEGSQVDSSEEIVLGGYSAMLMNYSSSNATQGDLKYLVAYTVVNGKAYIVTYTAKPEEFDTYVEDALALIDSFEIYE